MKKTLFALGLVAISGTAMAQDALVLDSNPNIRNEIGFQNVPVTQQVCDGRQSYDGVIERGVGGIFGSTEGLIGTAIGTAIGDKIGGGSGNEAAKIIGGVVGNKIGNNVARNKQTGCREQTYITRQQVTHQVIDGYTVLVELDGSQYYVNRSFNPEVGTFIPVQVIVQ